MNRQELLLENTYFTDEFDISKVEDDMPLNDADLKLQPLGNWLFYKVKGTDWHILPFSIDEYTDKDTTFKVCMMCKGIIIDMQHDAYSEKPWHEIIKLNIPQTFALENDFLDGNMTASLLLQNMNIKLKGDD